MKDFHVQEKENSGLCYHITSEDTLIQNQTSHFETNILWFHSHEVPSVVEFTQAGWLPEAGEERNGELALNRGPVSDGKH